MSGVLKRAIRYLAPLPNCDDDINESQKAPRTTISTPTQDDTPVNKKRRTTPSHTMLAIMITLLALPLIMAKKLEVTQFDQNIGLHFEGIGSTRVSRSEWNIVAFYSMGNIANSLFGVLDTTYAEEMSSTINTIKDNDNHLQLLLRNQTSIIDTTLNIFKADEIRTREKFENLDAQLAAIVMRLQKGEEDSNQNNLFRIFISLSIQLTIMLTRLQRIQSAIVIALSDSHHGKISPALISASQLQNQLVQVRNHIPAYLQLPIDKKNLLQLYNMMNVKGGVTDNHVIFHISFPLCEPYTFDLFKLHPIPALVNNTMISTTPCSDFIAINAHRDQYIVMNEGQWKACVTIKEDEFLCPHILSKYNMDATRCLCEISLLNNNTNNNCKISKTNDDIVLTELHHNNQWMYTMRNSTRITTVCGEEHFQLLLKGSGLLKLDPDCSLKTRSIIIQGHQSYFTSLQSSFTTTANISEIAHPTQVQALLKDFPVTHYTDHLQNISDVQNKLHEQLLSLPPQIQHIKYHHAVVGYIAPAIMIGLAILLLYKTKQRKKIQIRQEPPVAATRQRATEAEFITTGC